MGSTEIQAVFESGGVRYAVNGSARGRGGAADILTIQAKSGTDSFGAIGMDLSPLIERGLELC